MRTTRFVWVWVGALLGASLSSAATLEASPRVVLVGRDAVVGLVLSGIPAEAKDARVSCSAGEVRNLRRTGADFKADWTPPHEAGWVLCAAAGPGLAAWTVIEVDRRDVLSLAKLPPLARVEVELGGERFGPVRANAEGSAEVSITLTPRATQAQVIATPVGLAPVTRTQAVGGASEERVVVVTQAASVIADSEHGTNAWAFGMSPEGKLEDFPISFSASRGTWTMRRTGVGVHAGTFVADASGADVEAVLTAKPRDGKPTSLRLKLLAGVHPRITLRSAAHELLADGLSTVALSVHVTDEQGRGLARQPVRLVVEAGVASRVTDLGEGVYTARFTAPSGTGREHVRLTAEVAGAEPASVLVALKAPPRISVELEPPEAIADGRTAVKVHVTARGADGRPVPDGTSFSLSSAWGTLPPRITAAGGAAETTLTVGTRAGEALVEVNVLDAAAQEPFHLVAGPAARVTLAPEQAVLTCDGKDSSALRVAVVDAHGNGLEKASVSLVASSGRFDPVATLGPGEFESRYYAPAGCHAGPVTLAASVANLMGGATLELARPPPKGALSIRVAAQSNLTRWVGPEAELEGNARLPVSNGRLLAAVTLGVRSGSFSTQGTSASGADFALSAQPVMFGASVGPRWHFVDDERWLLYAATGVDAHWVRIPYSPSYAATRDVQTGTAFGFDVRCGGGRAVGPGVVEAQLRFGLARLTGNGAAFQGQVDGLSAGIGYRVPF